MKFNEKFIEKAACLDVNEEEDTKAPPFLSSNGGSGEALLTACRRHFFLMFLQNPSKKDIPDQMYTPLNYIYSVLIVFEWFR